MATYRGYYRDENKTPEMLEEKIRRAYIDIYRHAEKFDNPIELVKDAYSYGVDFGTAFGWAQYYEADAREFYADTNTVRELMACNH